MVPPYSFFDSSFATSSPVNFLLNLRAVMNGSIWDEFNQKFGLDSARARANCAAPATTE
jgi:hypothetical protein